METEALLRQILVDPISDLNEFESLYQNFTEELREAHNSKLEKSTRALESLKKEVESQEYESMHHFINQLKTNKQAERPSIAVMHRLVSKEVPEIQMSSSESSSSESDEEDLRSSWKSPSATGSFLESSKGVFYLTLVFNKLATLQKKEAFETLKGKKSNLTGLVFAFSKVHQVIQRNLLLCFSELKNTQKTKMPKRPRKYSKLKSRKRIPGSISEQETASSVVAPGCEEDYETKRIKLKVVEKMLHYGCVVFDQIGFWRWRYKVSARKEYASRLEFASSLVESSYFKLYRKRCFGDWHELVVNTKKTLKKVLDKAQIRWNFTLRLLLNKLRKQTVQISYCRVLLGQLLKKLRLKAKQAFETWSSEVWEPKTKLTKRKNKKVRSRKPPKPEKVKPNLDRLQVLLSKAFKQPLVKWRSYVETHKKCLSLCKVIEKVLLKCFLRNLSSNNLNFKRSEKLQKLLPKARLSFKELTKSALENWTDYINTHKKCEGALLGVKVFSHKLLQKNTTRYFKTWKNYKNSEKTIENLMLGDSLFEKTLQKLQQKHCLQTLKAFGNIKKGVEVVSELYTQNSLGFAVNKLKTYSTFQKFYECFLLGESIIDTLRTKLLFQKLFKKWITYTLESQKIEGLLLLHHLYQRKLTINLTKALGVWTSACKKHNLALLSKENLQKLLATTTIYSSLLRRLKESLNLKLKSRFEYWKNLEGSRKTRVLRKYLLMWMFSTSICYEVGIWRWKLIYIKDIDLHPHHKIMCRKILKLYKAYETRLKQHGLLRIARFNRTSARSSLINFSSPSPLPMTPRSLELEPSCTKSLVLVLNTAVLRRYSFVFWRLSGFADLEKHSDELTDQYKYKIQVLNESYKDLMQDNVELRDQNEFITQNLKRVNYEYRSFYFSVRLNKMVEVLEKCHLSSGWESLVISH